MPRFRMDIHLLRTLIINSITASIALGLALNRRRNPELQPSPWPPGLPAPFIEIIIPARNEARNIGRLLRTLLAQTYPAGRFRVTVVDDASSDDTARIVCEIAELHPRVRLVGAPPLPPGWTGKNHAMYTGFLVSSQDAEYLLFVDADTRHAPDTLSTAILRARDTNADLLSLITDIKMSTFWEWLIVPQMGELYTLLAGTMDRVNRAGGNAAANGQFLLIRRELYAQIGPLDSVRSDVAEDRAIASAAKARGHRVRLEYGRLLVRVRPYQSLRAMWNSYTKTLFWATGRNTLKTVAVALALALYALVPPAALFHALVHRNFHGKQSALNNAPLQLLPMLLLRLAICKRLGIPPVYALAYPLAVAVGDAMLLYSLYRVVSGKGVGWKGRTYI